MNYLKFSKLPYLTKLKIVKISLISLFSMTLLLFLIMPILFIKLKNSRSVFTSAIIDKILSKNITPPVLSGNNDNGGSYYLSADKVTNNLFDFNQNNANAIMLTNPFLLYSSKNGMIFNASSSTASVNANTKVVVMPHNVVITSNQGHKGLLHNVTMSLNDKTLTSNDPVTASYQNATLNAKSITMQDFGNIIILKGPVVIQTEEK
ncbi:LPS export ABC transporter periplasmic protein LptC [Rickettsiales bacterium LUAb2]